MKIRNLPGALAGSVVLGSVLLLPAAAQASVPRDNVGGNGCTIYASSRWDDIGSPSWGKDWIDSTNCGTRPTFRVHITCRSRVGTIYNFYGPAKTGNGTATSNDSYVACGSGQYGLANVWFSYYYGGIWHNKWYQFR